MAVVQFDESLMGHIPWLVERYQTEIRALARDHTPEQIERFSAEITQKYLLERACCDSRRHIDPASQRDIMYVNMQGDSISAWIDVRESLVHNAGVEGWIKWLIAAQKRQGFGSQTLNHYLGISAADIVTLHVAKTNTVAVRLYEDRGFTVLKEPDPSFLYMGFVKTEKGERLSHLLSV